MPLPFITVLITTHNYGRFIEEAIHSVLAQDFAQDQIEILVVDDGSTDDTAERVKKYGSRVTYLYKPNGGQASALNFGIEKARADVIAFLDADDLFAPGKLAGVSAAFAKNPALGLVYHPYEEWYMQTNIRRVSQFPLVSGDLRASPEQFARYHPHPTSSTSVSRKALQPLLPIPETIRMAADSYLVNLIPFISPICALPEALTIYRMHGKNSGPYFENIYQADDSQMPIETRKKRMQAYQIAADAMRRWLADNGYTRKQPSVRSFLDRWARFALYDQLLIEPPGRLHFFWLMVRENNAHSPTQSWKLTAMNYLACPLALIFGYKRADSMYKFRGSLTRTAERIFRKFSGRAPRPNMTVRTEDR